MGGNEVGNGGDVIVCREKGEIKSIQLLDFYESTIKNQKEISTTLTDENSILKEVQSRIFLIDPKRGELFERKIQAFHQETHFLENAKLVDIPDSFHIVLPKAKDCKLEQIAILDKSQKDPKKKFIIDKNLWEKLGPLDKAGLVMHETVYDLFADLGEKNSIKARSYNSFIFGTYDSKEYWKFVKDLRIPLYR